MAISGLVAVAPTAQADPPAEATIEIVAEQPWGTVWTDPDLVNTAIHLVDYGTAGVAFDATWSIEDSEGTTVLGPVEAGSAPSGYLRFKVDIAHDGGAGLDGDYVIRVTNTVQTSDGPGSASTTREITLAPQPPSQAAPGARVIDGVLRRAKLGYDRVSDTHASFTAPVLAGPGVSAQPGWIVIRNAQGHVVGRDTPVSIDDGRYLWTLGGAWRPGRYTAEAHLPDHYGRTATVALGPVRVFGWKSGPRSARTGNQVTATLHAPRHGSRSAVFHLRAPRCRGAIETLRTRVRTSAVGSALRVFSVQTRVPGLSSRWTGAWSLFAGAFHEADREVWHPSAPWQVPERAAGARASGQRIDVRVTVDDGQAVRISGLDVSAQCWHWAI